MAHPNQQFFQNFTNMATQKYNIDLSNEQEQETFQRQAKLGGFIETTMLRMEKGEVTPQRGVAEIIQEGGKFGVNPRDSVSLYKGIEEATAIRGKDGQATQFLKMSNLLADSESKRLGLAGKKLDLQQKIRRETVAARPDIQAQQTIQKSKVKNASALAGTLESFKALGRQQKAKELSNKDLAELIEDQFARDDIDLDLDGDYKNLDALVDDIVDQGVFGEEFSGLFGAGQIKAMLREILTQPETANPQDVVQGAIGALPTVIEGGGVPAAGGAPAQTANDFASILQGI